MACIRKRRGKWVVDYRDTLGKRKWITVEGSREDAENELARVIKGGKQPVNRKITFRAYAESWLAQHKANLKASTYGEYDATLKKHVYPIWGNKRFAKITRDAVKDLITAKRDSGLSRSTVRNIIAPIRGMFNAAIDSGLLGYNPAAQLGKVNKRTPGQEKKIDPLDRDELAVFLTSTREKMPHWFPLFLCAPRTGIREGELIALRPLDVDFHGRFIHVQRNFSRGQITTPKNGKTRKVDMSRQLTDTLREHIEKRKSAALRREMGKPLDEPRRKAEDVIVEVMEGPLFTTPTGERLDPSNLRKVFWAALTKAGLRRVRFHDLRHSFATLLLAQGESLNYVKEQLGHSSIKITCDVYGHAVPGGNRQAVDRLDDGAKFAPVAATADATQEQKTGS
jgi:integrase